MLAVIKYKIGVIQHKRGEIGEAMEMIIFI